MLLNKTYLVLQHQQFLGFTNYTMLKKKNVGEMDERG